MNINELQEKSKYKYYGVELIFEDYLNRKLFTATRKIR